MTSKITETYGTEGRLELSFQSFLKISLFFSLGTTLVIAFVMYFFIATAISTSGHEIQMFIWSIMLYAFSGFVCSFAGAVLIYPFYKYWCSKNRGQAINGKIAIHKRNQ